MTGNTVAESTSPDATAAETRRVALALFAAMEDIAAMDALIAPDATVWTLGAGYLNRADFTRSTSPTSIGPSPHRVAPSSTA